MKNWTISESDFFSPDPEYDAYLDLLLIGIRTGERKRNKRKEAKEN